VIGLDREIAIQLRKLKKDIVLVCNKAEGLDPSFSVYFCPSRSKGM
jgi:GTP-binding protein